MEVADPAPTPEGHALLEQMQRIFVEVLQEIDENQRTVYLMHVKDEIPIPEIAEALGLPENTVRSRLHRAHRAIDAGVARRRTKAGSALAPLLVPAALVDAARKGFDVDPAAQAVGWSRLARLLGIGIVGKLAPASGAAIAGGAVVLLALGAGSGALALRAHDRRGQSHRDAGTRRAVSRRALPRRPAHRRARRRASRRGAAGRADGDARARALRRRMLGPPTRRR